MSGRSYPRISGRNKLPRVPMCCICGAVATWRITVQVSWFRGEDEVRDVCEAHARSHTAEELACAVEPAKATGGAA